jgi:hypothetical protein
MRQIMGRNRTLRGVSIAAPLLAVLVIGSTEASAGDQVEHQMKIDLDPASHLLRVADTIRLPSRLAGGNVDFLLNSVLQIKDSDPHVERVPAGDATGFYGINGSSVDLESQVELARYRMESVPAGGTISIVYEGVIDFGLSEQKEEYTRGFRETAGVVGEEGVFLAGSGFWYPYFDDQLIEFRLEAGVREDWHLISQGNGVSRDDEGLARWASDGPMDEIYLVGGPLVRYSDAAGAAEALVYLHEEDDALAAKYLTTTAQYLEMYRQLIGPYPYDKFALVENFWETGYGMPSFTLLGPSIIRFPFILHSSYPHEILHNWWGNSVFVDYSTGNWAEGLTAYLADHLVQEQRGKGSEYRRSTLQKYRNYVKEGRDFPLSEFRSRHSAATEAVGYGKTLMGFHMLRRHLGDEAFRQALVRFYRGSRGKRASFRDLQATFEKVADEDLGWFFDAWVDRAGAASLAIAESEVTATADGFLVSGRLEQIQDGEPFPLEVPVVVHTASEDRAALATFRDATADFQVTTSERPLSLSVDPEFDLFRKLDPRETPPSIGQIFGEPEILAVLPSAADEAALEAYRQLMEAWQSDSHSIETVADNEIEQLPANRAVWILGRENRFVSRAFGSDAGIAMTKGAAGISLAGEEVPFGDHSLVIVRRHPQNLEMAVGWLSVEPAAAFPGMARKLPHYGKYSYLGFAGEEPTNVVKGQWAALDSPLNVDLRPESERSEPLATRPPAARTALAELPPVFSQQALMEHVARLAAPELEGRGVGSDGLARAADYIAEQLRAYGLAPGGDNGSFFQQFTVPGPDGEQQEVANVIGYLEGSKSEWSDQSFLVGAHYDHLGRGWPDVRQGNEGKLHPGADDNASGVAVFLELAKDFAATAKPQRNLVFVAFTAEEAGRLGSEHFAEHPTPFPFDGIRGIINLDTIGRLGDGAISVLGTGTSEEWQHIFRGAGFVTGIDSRNVPEAAGGSDQMSFINRGIPGVQIFTAAHEDYHAPTDTPDKIDGGGLIRVAVFVKEAIAYMAEREEPLTVTIDGEKAAPAQPAASGPRTGRRVRFGTVPDFAFQGVGVKVDSVVPDSPAARAGVESGDVLLAIDGSPIDNLQAYSDLLKTLTPDQEVDVTISRAGEQLTLLAVLEAR